jgi:two-component system response regulator MprA
MGNEGRESAAAPATAGCRERERASSAFIGALNPAGADPAARTPALGRRDVRDRRLVGQHPLVGVAAVDEASLAQDDAVGADVAAAVGEVPEQAVQAILDARQVAEGQGDRGAPCALVDAVDERGGELRVAGDALGEGGVEDEQAAGLEHLPPRLEADDALLGAVIGSQEVALGDELGSERLGALEIAHQQAAEHQQAVAAADALGGRVWAPAPARNRHAAGHRGGACFGEIAAGTPRELTIRVEQSDGLDRALATRAHESPARGAGFGNEGHRWILPSPARGSEKPTHGTIRVMRILVVDDEPAVRAALERALGLERYEIELAADGVEALDRIAQSPPDAIVLDVAMPGIDGLEVCRRLRAAGDRTPVLMLTARDAVDDRVEGLDAGADDYLVKPFALRELQARLRALLRRTDRGAEPLRYADLALDPVGHEVRRGDRRVDLSRTEFSLLELFMRHPRQVLTRGQIFEAVWGYDLGATSNALGVYMGYLRRKVEEGGEPRLLQTVRGIGYVLREE